MKSSVKITSLALSILLVPLSVRAQSLSLSLQDCKDAALSHNAYIENAALDVKSAELQKKEALWEYFPRVSAVGLGYYSLNPLLDLGIIDILGNNDYAWNIQNEVESLGELYGINTRYRAFQKGYTASVSLMQPLYAGGRIVHGNQLARVGVQAARLQGEIQNRKTSTEIESLWWDICALKDKIATIESLESTMDALYVQLQNAVASGLASETDLLQIELKRSELKAGKKKAQSGEKLLKMNLLNSVGIEYSISSLSASQQAPLLDSIKLQTSAELVPESPEHYYQDVDRILDAMGEKELLDLQVKAKRLEKEMAIGEALPQVGVGVSAGYSNLYGNAGKFNSIAFATVQVPLSDWGKVSRKAQRMELQIQKAENQRDFLSEQLHLQVEKYWLDLTSSYDEWEVAKEKRGVAERLYNLSVSHFQNGLVSSSELLQAEASFLQAASAESDALSSYRKAVIAYIILF